MLQKVKNRDQGFTIIEVLIVLAIAGLILLVVFMAVPALQRNSRNTQRNNDIAGLLGGLNEFVTNNNGQLPSVSCDGPVTGGSGCEFLSNVNLGYYTADNVSYEKQASAQDPNVTTNDPTSADLDKVTIYNNAKCDGTQPTAEGATSRSIIAVYAVESGSGGTWQCRES